jgi:hypothetical protein
MYLQKVKRRKPRNEQELRQALDESLAGFF